MATPSAGDLRNFATVGDASSGKTTLSEAMLACAGVIGRVGNIAQGTTVSDYHVSEKQHQISTQTSLLHSMWMGKKLNILDTPGYLDFISEAHLFSRRSCSINRRSRERIWSTCDWALYVIHV
jgi:elongation factor G